MLEDNNENVKVCKVVLLGQSGVGKTCIIGRYVNGTFNSDVESTQGASFASKLVRYDQNNTIKFDIWDTAGQEKYRSLSKIFYKDANIAILVYDITDKNSFEDIKNYWYKQLDDNASKNINKL